MVNGTIDSLDITDEKLNLFIDEQLDKSEMDAIHQALLDDKHLRERVCQLKAVKELVGYAYSAVPRSRVDRRLKSRTNSKNWLSAIAASVFLIMGVLAGWVGHTIKESPVSITSSREIFDYFSNNIPANHTERKIVIHVSTGDLLSLQKALDEADRLLKSYGEAGAPLSIDVVANKSGINLLRTGVSPYASRIKQMVQQHDNIQFYACARSIAKAKRKEGHDFAMLPQAHIARPARELIPERIDDGWIYIKV